MARGSRQAGSGCKALRLGRALCAALLVLASACSRGRTPPEPAPAPATSPKSAAPTPPAAAAPSGAAGGAAVVEPALTEPLTGDGLFLCTNKYEEQVVQRVALPTGQAFLISHGATWL